MPSRGLVKKVKEIEKAAPTSDAVFLGQAGSRSPSIVIDGSLKALSQE
jgi:hypothetical protein